MEDKNNYRLKLIASAVSASLLISGCSFDKDDDVSEEVNLAPSVQILGQDEAQEKTAFTLSANAIDTDGQIINYSWQHDSTLNLSAQNPDSNEITYLSPDITEDVTVNFSVTVEDDDGATTTATQQVLIKRNSTAVTLNGLITDNTISFASVEITIGDKTYSATADENGVYTIVLDVDEALEQALVKVKAKGRDDLNPGVEFISQLSSVKKLATQAGDDGILDSDENFGVNTTNVTTAEYALIVREGDEPTSEDELDNALLNVDADEKVQLASLIKIIVDNPNYELPEGVNSTLDLVTDEEAAQQFEEDVNAQDPDLIEQTKTEIKEDEDLVTGSKESLVGEYIINSPRYYANTASHLTLNENGTGQYHAVTGSSLMWQEVSGKIEVTLQSPVLINRYSQVEDDVETVYEEHLNSFSLQVLGENDVFKTIDIKNDITVYENNVEVQNKQEIQTTNLILKNKTLSLNIENIVGEWVMERIEGLNYNSHLETIAFYEDGTGVVLSDNSAPFEWELANNKLTVTYDEDGSVGTTNFWFTKNLKAGYQLVSLDTTSADPADSQYGLMIKRQTVSLSDSDFVGRWHGYIGTPQSFDMNVYNDGTIMIGLGFTSYQGVINSGNFTRKRFRYNGRTVTDCEGFDSNCYLESQMRHEFLNVIDNRYFVLRTFENLNQQGEVISSAPTILIYDYSQDVTYSHFNEELLENYTELYNSDGSSDFITTYFNENGEQFYELELNNEHFSVELINGQLLYEKEGEMWVFEIFSHDEDGFIICNYAQGASCEDDDKISYSAKRPKVTLSVNSTGNGELSPIEKSSFRYHPVSFEIIPDEGYIVNSIDGCNGYIDENYYIVDSGEFDCEITATFKEEVNIAGNYVLNNSDIYYASAYSIELNEDYTGSITYKAKVDLTWQVNIDGSIEITPLEDFVLGEYQGFSNSTGMQEAFRDIATSLTLTPIPDRGSDWFNLQSAISKYENDALIEHYIRNDDLSLIKADDYLSITNNDVVGEWSIDLVSEETVYKVLFNENGSGTTQNLSNLDSEQFTWQLLENTIELTFNNDDGVESFHIIKDLNVGYQVITKGLFDTTEHTDSGIMIRRNEQAINAANFTGRHQFREGHSLDSYWSEIQVYDDGEVFFTFGTSAYQRGFEDGHLKRDLYYDITNNWQRVDWCDATLDSCILYGEFVYTLVAVDNNRYYVERITHFYDDSTQEITSSAHLYIHDYLPSTTVEQFKEYQSTFNLYESGSNGVRRWSVGYGDYNEELDKQYLTFQIDDAEKVNVELIDGKLELILDGQETVIELIDNDRENITFCKYLKGNSCLEADKINLSFSPPTYSISVESSTNGQLSIFDGTQVNYGQSLYIDIHPDTGYQLAEISGCDGFYNIDTEQFVVENITQDCQIQVSFEEVIPLAIQAGIEDQSLAQCVNDSGNSNPEQAQYLYCAWQGYTEINSLVGLENLVNLRAIYFPELNIGTHLDLSALENLSVIHIQGGGAIESLTVFDPSMVTELELRDQNLTTFDLSEYTQLERLSMFNNPLQAIDISAQGLLSYLDLQNTEISSLDLSSNFLLNELHLNSPSITELEIGHLVNLERLFLWGLSDLTQLNTSNLSNLIYLFVSHTGVNSLDLSNLSKLTDLNIAGTSINNLDFSKLDSLQYIDISHVSESLFNWSELYSVYSLIYRGAEQTSFDLTPFLNLNELDLSDNQLSELYIPYPEQLEFLYLSHNQFESIDLSLMSNLRNLSLYENKLPMIDVSNNSKLEWLDISNSELTAISGIESIQNTWVNIQLRDNPLSDTTIIYLEDLQTNQGFNNIYFSLAYRVTVTTSENGYVDNNDFTVAENEVRGINIFPDTGYEVGSVSGCGIQLIAGNYYEVGLLTSSCEVNVEFVVAIPLATKAGISDTALGQCVNNSGYSQLEEVEQLFCYHTNSGEITSLVGLESFSNLSGIYLSSLEVGAHLDLSALENLSVIHLQGGGAIESLTVFDPSIVTELELRDQNITAFDLSEYTQLERLSMYNNPLQAIDIGAQGLLRYLDLQDTEISSLDLSGNFLLSELHLNSPAITELEIGHLVNLEYLYLWGLSNLTQLNTSNLTNLIYLFASHSGINSLDLSNLPKLTDLNIAGTQITNLDFTQLDSLQYIDISYVDERLINWVELQAVNSLIYTGMGLTSFDLTSFTELVELNLSDSQLSEVFIPNPEKLQLLHLGGNRFDTIDLSPFTNLRSLHLNGNPLTHVDLSFNTQMFSMDIAYTQLETVTGIEFFENKEAFIHFEDNPLLDSTITYLEDLRDNQGFTNIVFSRAFTATVNYTAGGGGSNDHYTVRDSEVHGLHVFPDYNYVVDSVSGCGIQWISDNYYEFGPLTSSCEIGVEFIEQTP
ncbi:leucine-rich repeat domain-containing protein [Pseudoalteromonas carrageenovora]|uniref:leucine-rich repeat domain-containing protein n=1 Tax=Pseudoalteromonas TaxID=53246 RepID=UPI00073211DE|nr:MULTISPECIES: leucine-rich repeat domain-containing protein [Pseudoalteromonas]KTF11015.1 hypothetical protein ATS74_08490 [Pseudoalteromonas sp. H103]MDO6637008.1 leucine-rich repeat domain-containing protein [Pseudoalteromonas carrageenovora]MDO6649212.1 leucine-rich repeat domain-containing protein [Pseudoalteromonas carrageenovora]